MARTATLGLTILFVLTSLTGCISEQPIENGIELVVESETTNGTLVQVYSEGEMISNSTLQIGFDFSKTSADNELVSFGVDPLDGRESIVVDAESETQVEVEFFYHGIYNVTAFAVDENGRQQNNSISIRIELRIEWTESNTNEPEILTFYPQPMNEGPYPTMIEVYSTVENPNLLEDIGGGSEPVQVTWNIIDELDDVCQKKTTQIQDGETEYWNTIHFNTFQVHDLSITVDDSQERVSIDQSVTILYQS